MTRRLLMTLAALIAVLFAASPAQAAPDKLVKVYVVRDGDALPSIAQRTLGDPRRAGEILDLNKGQPQADGGTLDASGTLHTGWILRLPEDASGPDVQLGRVAAATAAAPKAYFNGKLVLALIGAVILAAITVAVVFRRRAARAAGGVWRRIAGGMALRRRIAHRARLRSRLAAEFANAPDPYPVAAELAAAGAETYAIKIENGRAVTAWVTGERLAPPWRAVTDGEWTRDGLPGPLPMPEIVPALVRPGGTETGFLYTDLTWLDGVLAIGGDPAVARATLTALLADLNRLRPDIGVTPLEADRPAGVTVEQDGMLLLAARQRALTAVIVVTTPLTSDDAARLIAYCARPGSTEAAIVLGDLPGAHWRWTAEADGTITLPVLNATVTVPAF